MFGWLKRTRSPRIDLEPRADVGIRKPANPTAPVPGNPDRPADLGSWSDPDHSLRERCRRLLVHPDYDEREGAAWRLGQLGCYGQLGDAVEAVVAELGALIRRPIEEDSKEVQAIDAAIMALAYLGRPEGIPHLAWVLRSNDPHLADDSQWTAADALGRIVGQSFMHEADPAEASRAWLRSRRLPGPEAN